METPLRGSWHCPIEGGNHATATPRKYKNSIRYATIQRAGALEPKDYPVGGEWKVCDPRNAPEFGATAYFSATLLTEVLNVPVGIINCSRGGPTAEGWSSKDILRNYDDIDLSLAGNDEKIHPMLQPMVMYSGMLKPANKYTVRGFLWYQGESNVGHPDYAKRPATMVGHWRGLQGQEELPFYLVEIVSCEYGEGDQAAYLREEQYKVTRLILNSGIVSTNDLVQDYEKRQIHPKEKRKIGERLCYTALNKTYGYAIIACEGLQYDHTEVDRDKITLFFKDTGDGLNRSNGIIGFEIAGKDMRFHKANTTIDASKKTVIISTPDVKAPIAVRCGFRNFQIDNSQSVQGLPVFPFRTDK